MATSITKLARERGLAIKDGTQPVTIIVTHVDIKKGKPKDPACCALAHATKRSYPELRAAYYFRSCCYLEFPTVLLRFLLPTSLQKEIVAIDRGGAMEPGEYHIRPPLKTASRAGIAARAKKRPGRHQPTGKGTPRRLVHTTTNVRYFKSL